MLIKVKSTQNQLLRFEDKWLIIHEFLIIGNLSVLKPLSHFDPLTENFLNLILIILIQNLFSI